MEKYRKYQRDREKSPLGPGPAFPLVSKLLRINKLLDEEAVSVVIVSRNDADTSLRIFNSVRRLGLGIEKGAFTNGSPSYGYLEAFGAALYLSAHLKDVRDTVAAGCAAAHVMGANGGTWDPSDNELRIGFDFDGVIADDESEQIYQAKKLEAFLQHEEARQGTSLAPGPIQRFLKGVGALRERATRKDKANIRTAIFTARSSPAHDRVVATLRKNGLIIDGTFFLGGLKKAPFVEAFKADIFFDDQVKHLAGIRSVATAFVPYGAVNSQPGHNSRKK